MNLESIVKKLFLGGTLMVALAVSLVTVGSYAYTTDPNVTIECTAAEVAAGTCKEGSSDAEVGSSTFGVSSKTTFSMTVPKVLTLSNVSGGSVIEATVDELATGTLSAKVTSNTGYTISLSATNPALTMSGTSNTIAAGNAVTANTWGIKKNGESAYTGLTTTAVPFFTSTGAAPAGVTTPFEIGVKVDATVPAGNYSTIVTVTAATN